MKRKHGGRNNVGMSLTVIQVNAKQMLVALRHLRTCGVLHCDINPDNMVVSDAGNYLKLYDFGFARSIADGENDIRQYLVSRFYQEPEIIWPCLMAVLLTCGRWGAIFGRFSQGRHCRIHQQ